MSTQPSQNPIATSLPDITPDEQRSPDGWSCQALFFFYTCGCRTPEPLFCCQPSTRPHEAGNPCPHKNPSLLTAKLPHACGGRIGGSEACGAEDPGAKEFFREVDTAERLDLVVSGGVKQDKIHNILPGKVEGAFTIDQVISKLRRDGKCRSALSPTATPFYPRSTTEEGSLDTACGDCGDTGSDKPAYDSEVDTDGAATDAEEDRWDEKSENRQNNSDVAEETIHVEVTHHTEFSVDEENNEFFDIELDTLTLGRTVDNEESESSTSAEEHMIENKEAESTTQPERSYDDIMRFYWAMGDSTADLKPKSKPSRTCYWGIASILGRFTRQV
ncbi:hypothetical protein E0Z10_g6270 [Xylaria hypoxylon]|uniref:Uncharacterized protein n=1 Tax=Xylaria hypoxylon TaxID=37992 RepID=A0A4Z0YYR7_9PEZI|nr:hypothetical protein E0Z10_g6270 [Xylaria hypoxylon]